MGTSHNFLCLTCKEYILVIEGSVLPCVVRREHSPNLSVCSILHYQSVCITADKAGREIGWVSASYGRRRGGLTLLSLKYSLVTCHAV